MIRTVSPEAVARLQKLADNSWRPPEIVALRDWIAGEKRALEVRVALTGGAIDHQTRRRAEEVVQAMLRLDVLYIDWAEGIIG
jgi:hypothetical protein